MMRFDTLKSRGDKRGGGRGAVAKFQCRKKVEGGSCRLRRVSLNHGRSLLQASQTFLCQKARRRHITMNIHNSSHHRRADQGKNTYLSDGSTCQSKRFCRIVQREKPLNVAKWSTLTCPLWKTSLLCSKRKQTEREARILSLVCRRVQYKVRRET